MWLDRQEYRELLGPQEMLVATFWIAVSCAFVVFTHIRYPHVRNGIWGFKYPHDMMFIYVCTLATWWGSAR
jgi:hypothetical protein